MNDKPPSTSGTGGTGFWSRVMRAVRGDSWSREEIQDLLQQSDAAIDPDEQVMLTGVLEVAETHVRDVMVPRSQMVVLEKDQTLAEMLDIVVESGHSRFPVIGEDRDEVLGVLLAKDLLKHFRDSSGDELAIERFLRDVAVIPESKRLNALLKEFRDSRSHMAIVVDEYGGVSGLLTIEDVIEEIVGEIDDEHDHEEAEYIKEDSQRNGRPAYSVRALTRIEDFNEYFRCQLDDEVYDTVGGVVMHELGRLPRRGESLQFAGFDFTVTKADRRRIDTLQVQHGLSADA
ncbi:MAG: transporter associated domain-containing protein [Pseudomonadota bacterium]